MVGLEDRLRVPRAATGSLRGDLRANAELVARTLADPRQGRLLLRRVGVLLIDGGRTAAGGADVGGFPARHDG